MSTVLNATLNDPLSRSDVRATRMMEHRGKLVAVVLAVLLHGTAMLAVLKASDDFQLTSAARKDEAASGLRVTLVALPKPVVQPAAAVTKQQPKPQHHEKVLVTHRQSPRKIVQADKAAKPSTPQPVETPMPSAPPQQSSPTQSATTPSTALPEASSVASVTKLACSIPQPPYPSRARRLSHEGNVALRVTIDAHGVIGSAVIEKSSGYEELDQAALQAMLAGHCEPFMRGSGAVAASAVQLLEFHLD